MNAEPAGGLSDRLKAAIGRLTEALRWLEFSPAHTSLGIKVAGSLLAGGFTVFLNRKLPYYPGDWGMFIGLAVAVAWFFRPYTAMYLTLAGYALPIAYNTQPVLATIAVFFMIVLSPFSFLLIAVMTVLFYSPVLTWLFAFVPMVAGFLGARRGVGVAALACIWAIVLLLVSGLASNGLLIGGSAADPMFVPRTQPAGSLLDFKWLAHHHGDFTDLWSRLGIPFFTYPILWAQIAVWSVTGGVTGWMCNRPSTRCPMSRLAATGLGGLVFCIGTISVSLLFGKGVSNCFAAITGTLLAAAMVTLAFPLIQGATIELDEQARKHADLRIMARKQPGEGWKELAGIDAIIPEVRAVIKSQFDLEECGSLRRSGKIPAKGLLLFGPPGTGKTKLAWILAQEAGAALFECRGTEFALKPIEEARAYLNQMFEHAIRSRPAVLFFDALEAFAPKPAGQSHSGVDAEGVTATFLTQLDGVRAIDGILIVGATNQPGLMDPEVLRPGRLDRLIYMGAPDLAARRTIFEHYLRGKALAADVDFEKLAVLSEQFSGGDIQNVCKEAMRGTIRPNPSPFIHMEEMEKLISAAKPSVTSRRLPYYEKIADEFSRLSRQYASEQN